MFTKDVDKETSVEGKREIADVSNHPKIRCDGGVELDSQNPNSEVSDCQISVHDLGGINSAELALPPGISVLVGRNATNRSSLLRSIAAGLGGRHAGAQLKTDAESGSVTLTVGDETYTREYTRNGQTVQKRGEPYTENSDLVDTFVALFADCPARRAVERDKNLREILMRPVDTVEIRSRISELKRERSDLDDTIQRAETRKKELPALEEDRTRLEDELATVEDEIADLESVVEEIEETSDDSNETAELRAELEELRSELSSAERRADQAEQQLEFRKKERADLTDERDELEAELEEFEDSTALETRISDRETELAQLSERRETLERAVEDLQSVIQVNETFLDGDFEAVGLSRDDSVAAALDPESQTIECWTCGTEVEQAAISDRVNTLREIATQQRTEVNEIEGEIADLKREKARYEDRLDDYEETTRRLGELDNRIEQHSKKIEELETEFGEHQANIDDLAEEIETVEAAIEDTETDGDDEATEFVDAHKELTKLERKRGRLENQLEATTDQIDEIEALDEKRVEAEKHREKLTDELDDLRGRIERLETELVETLNSIMEDLIDRLEYKNIARVWLERQRTENSRESEFALHIVREAEDGAVYEDTVDTLSESEREVVGLVISLAGYLVHDIDREVPFLLLDSVEMIDGRRLAGLLDYIQTETDVAFLSVALLPKDAQSVAETEILDEYTTIDFETISA